MPPLLHAMRTPQHHAATAERGRSAYADDTDTCATVEFLSTVRRQRGGTVGLDAQPWHTTGHNAKRSQHVRSRAIHRPSQPSAETLSELSYYIPAVPLLPRQGVFLCLFVAATVSVRAASREAKVATVDLARVERVVKERMKSIPKDTPKKDRTLLFRILKRKLLQELKQRRGGKLTATIRCRSVGSSGESGPDFDPCALYQHASRTISRGYGGQVLALVDALSDDKEWQEQTGSSGGKLSVQLELYVKPAWSNSPRPLQDGETLRDSGGHNNQGDTYCIVFKADRPCYVYIVQLDVTGRFYPLYPSKLFGSADAFGKSISPNMPHSVPPPQNGQAAYIYLDKNRGDESIYFLASLSHRPDIDAAFRYFEVANDSAPAVVARALERKARPKILRGPKGIAAAPRPAPITGPRINPLTMPAVKWYRPECGDIMITRWFVHR